MSFWGWKDKDLSHRILILLVTTTIVLFAVVYFVGYSHPYHDNPDFIEPQFTNVLLGFTLFVLLLSVFVIAWALIVAWRKRGGKKTMINKVPVVVISSAVMVFTVVLMSVSFLLGSSSTINVNGQNYEDTAWLKAADMFVISSLTMILLATVVVTMSAIRTYLNRK